MVAHISRSYSGNKSPNCGDYRWPSGNIIVLTNCLDITMAWKTSCKDVASDDACGSFCTAYYFFCLCLGGQLPLKRRPWSLYAPEVLPVQVIGISVAPFEQIFILLFFTVVFNCCSVLLRLYDFMSIILIVLGLFFFCRI